MVPAHAPLPTDCRFPFHRLSGPFSGSQTSILISESGTGVSVAATRQNPGRLRNDCGCLPLGAGRGDVNAPAAIVSAMVIVVFFSFRAVRLSQVAAPKTGATPHAAVASSSVMALVMVAAPY